MNESRPEQLREQVLVERARRHDLEAFGKIVDAYQNRVFGFVRRMLTNPEDASDVTQEVFVRAFQALGRFDSRSSLRTWLFRIAHNLCVDRARQQRRGLSAASLDAADEDDAQFELPDTRWDPEAIVMTDELVAIVEAAIASMSEKLRSVLLLHDREDLAYEEIARTLNVPVGTVKSRLFLARAHVQQALKNYVRPEMAQ